MLSEPLHALAYIAMYTKTRSCWVTWIGFHAGINRKILEVSWISDMLAKIAVDHLGLLYEKSNICHARIIILAILKNFTLIALH